jgi:hypothetical protein
LRQARRTPELLVALIFPRTRQSRDDKFQSVFARAFCLTTLLYDADFLLSRREQEWGAIFLTLPIAGRNLLFPFRLPEASMKNVAVGLRVHSGWSALVALSLEKGEPVVLSRERLQLVETFNYSFRQPYHTAAKGSLEEGREFISKVKAEATRLALLAFRTVQRKLDETDYRLTHCGLLLASARPLPDLEKILAAHPLIHTAEGVLFRGAVSAASREYGLKELQVKEKGLLEQAVVVLRCGEDALLRRITDLGRPLGSPWSQDEKFATLAAWLALSEKRALSAAPKKAVRA